MADALLTNMCIFSPTYTTMVSTLLTHIFDLDLSKFTKGKFERRLILAEVVTLAAVWAV